MARRWLRARCARVTATPPLSSDPMPYEVQTPVSRGPVRPAAPPDPARAGRSLRDLALPHRRRLPGRDREDGDARPRDHHRVPAHRGHAGRAEVQAPAARGRRRRPRRRVRPLGGARPPHRPPARLQDVQGRRRRCSASWPTRRRGPTPAPPGLEDQLPRAGARPARRHRRRRPPGRLPAGDDPQAQAGGRHRPHPLGAGQRARRGRGAGRRAAPAGPHHVPTPHRGVRRAARDRRALPGRARAVQAGLRRARPARRLRRHRDRLGGLAGARASPTWPASTPTTAEDTP